jgi:hypothetical protein
MVAMKSRLLLSLLCLALVSAVQARAKTILPDACGDDSVKFDVKTEKDHPAPVGPAEGKAQIVLIEYQDSMKLPVRYGLDGAWIGANYGNSYFTVDVLPGVHHLCANMQYSHIKNIVDMSTFTAEAGKVYYITANVIFARNVHHKFKLLLESEDVGKYRVKTGEFATWKTK